MPEFIRGREVKVRRSAGKKYLQVTIPKILRDNEIVREGDKLTPVFDNVLIYLPKGKRVDMKKLKGAVIEEEEDPKDAVTSDA